MVLNGHDVEATEKSGSLFDKRFKLMDAWAD